LQVKIPKLDVQHAGLASVAVGHVAIGPITVGDLIINNVDFAMSAAQGVLQDVHVTIKIHVELVWHIHVGLPWPIPDINVGDTYDLGTLTFGMPVGNIVIPGLNNLHFNIPALTAQNLSVAADPLSLQLQNAAAEAIEAKNVSLPTAGFTLAGLTLGSVEADGLAVPAAAVEQATIGHFHGDPIHIPSFSLKDVKMPSAQIPDIKNSAPLDIPANLQTRSVGFGDDGDLLEIRINLTPSAISHIDRLEITGANASASVGQVVLHNVVLPYDVLNLTLSQIGINTVAIPLVSVS
jgi:hypothetical protein